MKKTTIALALGLGMACGAHAGESVDIMYEVIGTAGEAYSAEAPASVWKRISVDSDELAETVERLKNDATIGDIEFDQQIEMIRPVKEEKAYPSVRAQSVSGQSVSDPEFSQQQVWMEATDELPGRLSIELGMGIYSNTKRMKIGFVDGGFAQTDDIVFAAGANIEDGNDTWDESILDPSCTNRHGNQGAHLAAAEANNGIGMAGIANADVYAARALRCDGSGSTFDFADAVTYLIGDPVAGVTTLSGPVDVINMSLTGIGACPGYMQSAIDAGRAKGVVFVVAAGNDSTDVANRFPASCEGVITVGANRFDSEKSSFTNDGEEVDIFATGSGVFTTSDSGDYVYVSGTSFSSPIVAGHAALIKAVEPEADEFRILSLLTSTDRPALENGVAASGAGIMDSFELARGLNDQTYVARPLVHAMMHEDRMPSDAYTQAAAALNTCNLYEVDTAKLDVVRGGGQFFKVFEVAKSSDFTVTNGVEVASSQGSRVLLKNVDPTVNNYGLSVCNADNSACDQEIPVNLNVQKSFTNLYCS